MSVGHESIRAKIGEEIKNLAPKIEVAIVTHLADKERTRRTDAWLKVFDQLDKAEKDLDKLRPDQSSFDENGAKQTEWYSKTRADDRKKLGERIVKLKGALNKSIEKGEWKDVFDLANQQAKPDAPKGSVADAKSDGKDTEES